MHLCTCARVVLVFNDIGTIVHINTLDLAILLKYMTKILVIK